MNKNKILENEIKKTISELNLEETFTAEIKVSVYDIENKIYANVNADKSGWAASIIKVPVMIATLDEIENKKLSLEEKLKVNHKFTLEPTDVVSKLPDNSDIKVLNLLYYMIVNSDNEATNILANHIGVEKINQMMLDLDMKKSMLGHLLCPKVPRYTSNFNPDGSNITCPNDMVKIFRHIYDDSFSKLSPFVRELSDFILTFTRVSYLNKSQYENSNIKAKVGYIQDDDDGEDIHEIGIIDNHLIVCVMLNKFKIISKPKIESKSLSYLMNKEIPRYLVDNYSIQNDSEIIFSPANKIYTKLMNTIYLNSK